ncbi:MAG: hypothetical protein JWR26_3192 [Pedosphaera sp.]|nr:hypothetical protein [Pedosphaera sp.]
MAEGNRTFNSPPFLLRFQKATADRLPAASYGVALCRRGRSVSRPAFAQKLRSRVRDFAEGKRNVSKAEVFAHGHHGEGHCPPSLRSPACGTGTLQKQTKCQQSGGTGRHLGGIWVGTWRPGNEFRPGWFAQMPLYARLYLLVPPFFRKFYRGCLRTATMRTATMGVLAHDHYHGDGLAKDFPWRRLWGEGEGQIRLLLTRLKTGIG